MLTKEVKEVELPKIFYSTWGEGFYSKVWINQENCWMYSMLKFVEANIDFEKDKHVLPLFEKMAASDFPFMYRNKDQRKYAEEAFTGFLQEITSKITITKKEVISAFPVDPFWCYFSYAVMLDEGCDHTELDELDFQIYKLGAVNDSNLEGKKSNTLSTYKIGNLNFAIYSQNFILYPNLYYMFSIPGKDLSITFKMPDRGIPFIIGDELEPVYIYDYDQLNQKLYQAWGFADELPPSYQENKGTGENIYSREQLLKILPEDVRTAVFKYNKESYSLFRFKRLSNLNPVIVFDDKLSLEDAADYINIPKTSIPVTNNPEDVDKAEFNTIVFTCNINFESELPIAKKLIMKALEKRYPVILLYDDIFKLDILQDALNDNNITNLYRIAASENDFGFIDIEKHIKYIPQKVLGIFGTDTVQGKFTTQTLLREELKKITKAKHFSTEPTGILVGADVGFSRFEDFDEKKGIAYHRKLIENLEKDSDVVITGGQNSIIYDQARDGDLTKNVSTRIFRTFLPKWIVLTISVDTDIKIIKDSLEYIKSINKKYNNDAKVIAFAMLVGRKIHGERWTETYFIDVDKNITEVVRAKVEKETGIKVFIVPGEISNLAECVKSNL